MQFIKHYLDRTHSEEAPRNNSLQKLSYGKYAIFINEIFLRSDIDLL